MNGNTTMTTIDQSGAPDPAANEPRMVTLQNGANAKVRNKTFMELLIEMQQEVEKELQSGDARIVTTAHRWWLLIQAALGNFDHPAPGHVEMLEEGVAGGGLTTEQKLMQQLASAQAENARLRARTPQAQIAGATGSTGVSTRAATAGDVTDIGIDGLTDAERNMIATARRNAAAIAAAGAAH